MRWLQGTTLTQGVAPWVLECTTVLLAGTAVLSLTWHPACRPEAADHCTGRPVGCSCGPYPHLTSALQA